MISRSALVREGAGAGAAGGAGERPWPGRSSAVAWTPREESDERTRRKDKDPAARPGRTRTRTRCAEEPPPPPSLLSMGREVMAKRPGVGSSLRTRPAARCPRRRGGRGAGEEEGGRMWGRRSARRAFVSFYTDGSVEASATTLKFSTIVEISIVT